MCTATSVAASATPRALEAPSGVLVPRSHPAPPQRHRSAGDALIEVPAQREAVDLRRRAVVIPAAGLRKHQRVVQIPGVNVVRPRGRHLPVEAVPVPLAVPHDPRITKVRLARIATDPVRAPRPADGEGRPPLAPPTCSSMRQLRPVRRPNSALKSGGVLHPLTLRV